MCNNDHHYFRIKCNNNRKSFISESIQITSLLGKFLVISGCTVEAEYFRFWLSASRNHQLSHETRGHVCYDFGPNENLPICSCQSSRYKICRMNWSKFKWAQSTILKVACEIISFQNNNEVKRQSFNFLSE